MAFIPLIYGFHLRFNPTCKNSFAKLTPTGLESMSANSRESEVAPTRRNRAYKKDRENANQHTQQES
ncbi:MAG: hypothetical protein OXU23_14090 [Candidatus Poribacteria bacterium]|nr:hypothetical protein [Candidatus Poribacteria bacterium]